jgi:UDP-N-acetylglucosamine/UDP-N-acetylgalactosamine diphosphorylase
MYKLPLPSQKSIFQIHLERILKIKKLLTVTKKSSNSSDNKNYESNDDDDDDDDYLLSPSIPIYIMTSDLNDQDIRRFFTEHNYFGYPAQDMFFFQQKLLPCFDSNGKVIFESEKSLALAPDGNGGIYDALRLTGAFEDMERRGIQYLHVYGVDNLLTKSLDPAFIGMCIHENIQCGNKVVLRRDKSEKVGLTVTLNQRMHILEYSEIPPSVADGVNCDGKLIFNAANICNHFLSVEFLKYVVFPNLSASYHIVPKKIPYLDPITKQTVTPTVNNGLKLEMFIFDVFPLAERWAVAEVAREDEFAPIKNANSTNEDDQVMSDSPKMAVILLSNQHKRWFKQVNATFLKQPLPLLLKVKIDPVTSMPSHEATEEVEFQDEDENKCFIEREEICEISPLLSYEGEGLESYSNQKIALPQYLSNPFTENKM